MSASANAGSALSVVWAQAVLLQEGAPIVVWAQAVPLQEGAPSVVWARAVPLVGGGRVGRGRQRHTRHLPLGAWALACLLFGPRILSWHTALCGAPAEATLSWTQKATLS